MDTSQSGGKPPHSILILAAVRAGLHFRDRVADEDRGQAAGDGLDALGGLVQDDHADAGDDHRQAGPEALGAQGVGLHGGTPFGGTEILDGEKRQRRERAADGAYYLRFSMPSH